MLRFQYVLLILVVVVVTGCSTTNKESAQKTPQAAPPTTAQPALQEQAIPPTASRTDPEILPPAASGNIAKPARSAEKAPAPPSSIKKAPAATSAPIAAPPVQAIPAPAKPEVVQPVTAPPAAAPPVAVPSASPTPPPVIKPPEPKYATIPQGTDILVRLQQPLDSGTNKTGDTFRAILDRNIEVDGIVVAPRGSILDGQVSQVERAGRVQGKASITLELDHLIVDNETYPLRTAGLFFEAKSSIKKDATKVGIGAGLGAIIGAVAGGGKGAAIGSAVGAGAGGATVAATRGDEVRFESEHKLTFVLRRDVRMRIQ